MTLDSPPPYYQENLVGSEISLVSLPEGSQFVWQTFSEGKLYGYSTFFQLHHQPSTQKNVLAYLLDDFILGSCNSTHIKQGQDEVGCTDLLSTIQARRVLDLLDRILLAFQECFLLETPEFRGYKIHLSSNEYPTKIDKNVEIFLRDLRVCTTVNSPI